MKTKLNEITNKEIMSLFAHYCYDKKYYQKNQFGRKRIIWLTLPNHSPSLKEVGTEIQK